MAFKKILNLHEEATLHRLQAACKPYWVEIHSKLRVADVLPIEGSGISDSLFTYALKAHFDFVVATVEHEPLFAVEYDGPPHAAEATAARDRIKNALCQRFGLPLLRIDSRYLPRRYRNQALLAWVVGVFLSKRNHQQAQADGLLPIEESFYPFNIIGGPGDTDVFPFRLALPSERVIRTLYKLGKCSPPYVARLIGKSPDGWYRAIAAVPVTHDVVAFADAKMLVQLFPVRLDDLLDELLVCKVQRALLEVVKGRLQPLPMAEFCERAKLFEKEHEIWHAAFIHPGTGQLTCLQ